MFNEGKKVNLFLLGAAKCGSTTLSHYLNQHPEILLAKPKEPLFFEAEYGEGYAFYHEKYFSHYDGEATLVDARHRNLYLPYVAKRIKEYASSDAKFLVILREPVSRAYSHWWHNYSWGDEKRSFDDSVRANIQRLETGLTFEDEEDADLYRSSLNFSTGYSSSVSYIDTGFYAQQIERFISLFGSSRVKIVFLEDLQEAPRVVLEDVFSFIGVDYPEVGIDYTVRNKATSVAGKSMLKVLGSIPGRKLIPQKARGLIYRLVRNKFLRSKQVKGMSPHIKEYLKKIYEPHILELENLTGRNLDVWREN